MVHTVDGGKTFLGQGTRVSGHLRSQGIWRYLRDYVNDGKYSHDITKQHLSSQWPAFSIIME